MGRALLTITIALTALGPGCEREPDGGNVSTEATSPVAVVTPATKPAASARPRVVFLGDSLTAGLGVDADEAFPSIVGKQLEAEGIPVQIVNAGVSGDTTAGGLRRLDWLLKQSPDVLVVGLGANDGLRGLSLAASEENLRQIVQRARGAGARVLLLGMMIPPNYGPEYATGFREIYPRLAKELKVPLVPFVLEGVGGNPDLNQPDGIHPTPAGHRVVAGNVTRYLRQILSDPGVKAGR